MFRDKIQEFTTKIALSGFLLTANFAWSKIGNMKSDSKKKITTDELAGMVARGFDAVNKQFNSINSKMDEKFKAIDGRFDGVDERLDSLDVRLGHVEKGVLDLKGKTNEFDNKFIRQSEFNALSLRVVRLEKISKK